MLPEETNSNEPGAGHHGPVVHGDFVDGDKVIQQSAAGDIVNRDKIVNYIQHINERALSAAEDAAQEHALERKTLAEGVAAFVARLRVRAASGETPTGGNPYRGLLQYSLGDAEIFFGRLKATDELLDHLARAPLTVLQSESGAGKTSLIQAGLSPRLLAAGHLPVYLRPYNVEPGYVIKRAFLADPAQAPLLATAPLREFLRQVGGVLGPERSLYLMLDQFEEFFTQLAEPARAEFVRELAECLDDPGLNVRWLLALRTEHFGQLALFRPQVRNPFDNDYRLNRLTRAEAEAVMVEPARRRGVAFEAGLVQAILDDLGGIEVAPPELQLVCSALWEERTPGDAVLGTEAYAREGGAAGILRGHLARVLARQLLPQQRALARRLLEALTSSERQRLIRSEAELLGEVRADSGEAQALGPVLSQLVDSRLVRTLETPAGPAYELAHDYLLGEIQLDPDVQARKAAQELLEQETRSYRRYHTLLSKDRLKVIEPYLPELRLTPESQALVAESRVQVQAAEREREALQASELEAARQLAEAQRRRAEEQARSARRLRVALAFALAAAIVSATLGWLSYRNSRKAQVAAIVAQADQQLAGGDRAAAAMLGYQALTIDPESGQAERVLGQAVRPATLLQSFAVMRLPVLSANYRPDGGQFVTGGPDGAIRVWDAATGQLALFLAGQQGGLASVGFNPDGTLLLTAGHDGTVRLWEAGTGQPVRTLPASNPAVPAVGAQFSADGRYIVVAYHTDVVKVWEAATGAVLRAVRPVSATEVTGAAFSPDGRSIIVVSYNGPLAFTSTIDVYDVATGAVQVSLSKQAGRLYQALFSPDGSTIASVAFDGTISLWDATTGQLLRSLAEPGVTFIRVTFSPDGSELAAGTDGGQVSLWKTSALDAAPRHWQQGSAAIHDLAFNPDGTRLLAANDDGTANVVEAGSGRQVFATQVRSWDAPNARDLVIQAAQREVARAVLAAFSPDGARLAVAGTDGTVRLWSLANSRNETTLPAAGETIALAYSPDGTRLATLGKLQAAEVWNLATGQRLFAIQGPADTGLPGSLAFSPDGKRLATWNGPNALDEWDAADGHHLRVLEVSGYNLLANRMAYRPDGAQIAVAGLAGVSLIDADGGRIAFYLSNHLAAVNSVAYSPDGQLVVTASDDQTARLWNSQNGREVGQLAGGGASVVDALFSPDGKRVITVGGDGVLRVWDAGSGQELLELPGYSPAAGQAAFSQGGVQIAAVDAAGLVRVWSLWSSRAELLASARDWCGRCEPTGFDARRFGLPSLAWAVSDNRYPLYAASLLLAYGAAGLVWTLAVRSARPQASVFSGHNLLLAAAAALPGVFADAAVFCIVLSVALAYGTNGPAQEDNEVLWLLTLALPLVLGPGLISAQLSRAAEAGLSGLRRLAAAGLSGLIGFASLMLLASLPIALRMATVSEPALFDLGGALLMTALVALACGLVGGLVGAIGSVLGAAAYIYLWQPRRGHQARQ